MIVIFMEGNKLFIGQIRNTGGIAAGFMAVWGIRKENRLCIPGNFNIGNYEYYATLSEDNYVFGKADGTLASGLCTNILFRTRNFIADYQCATKCQFLVDKKLGVC